MDKDIGRFIEAYLQQDKGFQEEIRKRMKLIDCTFDTLSIYNNNRYSTQRQKDVLLSCYRKNIKRVETLVRVEYPSIRYEELDGYIEYCLTKIN